MCFVSLFIKLLRVSKLREATKAELFPTAAMVISMSREFGVPLTAEDFGGESMVLIADLHYVVILLQLPEFIANSLSNSNSKSLGD